MNFQLYNDKIYTFSLHTVNAANVTQPWPSGIPTVVSSNPASLSATISSVDFVTAFSLVLTPKVKVSPGLTVTVSNTGVAPAVFVVDVVSDPDMLSVVVDSTPTTVAQNVPTAPGP